jgi:hypothetical protein
MLVKTLNDKYNTLQLIKTPVTQVIANKQLNQAHSNHSIKTRLTLALHGTCLYLQTQVIRPQKSKMIPSLIMISYNAPLLIN